MKNIINKGFANLVLIAGVAILTAFSIGIHVKDTKTIVDLSTQVQDQQVQLIQGEEEIVNDDGENDETLGAFRPSGYTGKLLTRLTEGGSETTFNTTPGTAPDGSTLTTAKIGDFIVITVNPGAVNEEKISASAVSVSGTTATWTIINRGLSFTSTSSVTANKKQHAIGETVIISNDDHFLSTQYPSRDGNETITGQWTFSTFPITPDSPAGSETTAGILELATGAEAASSTQTGSLGRLALSTKISTSSCPSSGNVVVTTNDSGNIDQNCLPTSITATTTFATSTLVVGSTPVFQIGMNKQIITTTGTTTFTVPSGIKKLWVEALGAGGTGGSCSAGATNSSGGGGGGSGGYSQEIVNVSATTSFPVVVGAAPSGATRFGSPGSAFMFVTGGSSGSETTAGQGGTATGGDINIDGGDGQAGAEDKASSSGGDGHGGSGASSMYGGSGGGSSYNGSNTNGLAASGYGAGGGGGGCANGSASGGSSTQGIIIVRW